MEVDWIEHEWMLPSFMKMARIMKFGYDSLWSRGSPIDTEVVDIAETLLFALLCIREVCAETFVMTQI